MTRESLAQEITAVCKLTGEFLLRSGQTSHYYFDKYRFEAQPRLLKSIADLMTPLIPESSEALAGLELGGVPVATAISLQNQLPCLFVRKEAKAYGTCQFAEGFDPKGKRLCIVEDVVTTGGQVKLSTRDLRSIGAEVNTVVSVIYRGKRGENPFSDLDLDFFPLFTQEDLSE